MNSRNKVGFAYVIEELNARGELLSREVAHNLMPKEATNYMLASSFKGGVQYNNWFAGLFSGNYAPSGNETMATFPADATEFTGYSGASRPQVVFGNPVNGRIDNAANLIELTFSEDVEVRGGFLATSSGKGATTGVLGSVVAFSSPKRPGVGGVLRLAVAQELVG